MTGQGILKDPELQILIVDDSAQYARVLTMMLQSHFGYKNLTVIDNIADAYTEIRQAPLGFYNLLFVDQIFPNGETGCALLTKLAGEDLLRDTVTFLITCSPNADNIREAKAAGAIGVIAKPFNREQLQAQLELAERTEAAKHVEQF